jgi:hypothetical protein
MSTARGFYALSDNQLRRLLAGELAYAPFTAANKDAVLFRVA